MIFGGLLDPEIIQAAQHGLTINVFSLQYASHVQALLQPMGLHADVHIKVDTGFGRNGFTLAQIDSAIDLLLPLVDEGVFEIVGQWSHLAVADGPCRRRVR